MAKYTGEFNIISYISLDEEDLMIIYCICTSCFVTEDPNDEERAC